MKAIEAKKKKNFTTSKAKIPQYLILQENKNKKTARTQIMCIAQSNEGVILKKKGKKTIIWNLRKQKCIEKERKGGNWRGFVIGWGGQHQRKILPRTEDIKRREFLMSETIERGAKIFSTPDAGFNYSSSRRQGGLYAANYAPFVGGKGQRYNCNRKRKGKKYMWDKCARSLNSICTCGWRNVCLIPPGLILGWGRELVGSERSKGK